MRLTRYLPVVVLAASLAVPLAPSAASAQGVTWTEVTSFEIPALGRLGRMLTNRPVEQTVYMSETASATEEEDQTQVVNLDTESFLFIDHKEEVYSEMTFEDMVAMFEQNMQEVERQTSEARATEEGDTDVQYDFELDADATGETREISGYDANQLLITMQVIYDAEHTNEEGETATASGNFFVLVDSWRSEEAGSGVEQAFFNAYAETFGEQMVERGLGGASALSQAFEQDPRIGPALERIQEEQRKAPGTELMSKVYFVVAPEGQEELDVDAILNPEKEEKRGGRFGRLARRALGDRGSSDDSGGEPEQTVLFVLTTERSDYGPWSVEPERFQPPAGYEKVERSF